MEKPQRLKLKREALRRVRREVTDREFSQHAEELSALAETLTEVAARVGSVSSGLKRLRSRYRDELRRQDAKEGGE